MAKWTLPFSSNVKCCAQVHVNTEEKELLLQSPFKAINIWSIVDVLYIYCEFLTLSLRHASVRVFILILLCVSLSSTHHENEPYCGKEALVCTVQKKLIFAKSLARVFVLVLDCHFKRNLLHQDLKGKLQDKSTMERRVSDSQEKLG